MGPVRPRERHLLRATIGQLDQHVCASDAAPVVQDRQSGTSQRMAGMGQRDELALDTPQVRIPTTTTARTRTVCGGCTVRRSAPR